MLKLVDRLDAEVKFYDVEDAMRYLSVDGCSTLEDVADKKNELDNAEGTDFENRYYVVVV